MEDKINITLLRPFGPVLAKATMPNEIINKLNEYFDKIASNEKLSKLNDHGSKLAGNVTQEIKIDNQFVEESGWLKFLGTHAKAWIENSVYPKKEVKEFRLIDSWIVSQFKNEYNPTHVHNGHISGVGYLKVPKNFGEYSQKNKRSNKNGNLQLIHGSKQFLSESMYTVQPKIGDFYFFPNYTMHTVFPFHDTDEERRSVSFNAWIDEKVHNVYI